jgi:multidrug efflux system membrane fusion protein
MNRQRLASYLVVAGLLAAAGFAALQHGLLAAKTQAPPKRPAAVAVRIAPATRGATAVSLESIATVQAFNSVSVRARVDGQLANVRFTEGSRVRRGEILAEIDKRPFEVQLRAAIAQQARDAAQLPAAKRNLERYQELISHGAVTPQMLEAAKSSYDQLRAAVDADQAQIDQARLQLDYATIRAPIDGRVGARLVDVGNLVHAGDANGLVTISQIQPVSVVFALPQAMLPTLLQQQAQHPLALTAMAPDGSSVLEQGRLALIDSQVDQATGTIRCKGTFDNTRERLWPGAFVTVRVALDALPDAVTVPTAAVQAGPKGPYVYVMGAGRRAQLRDIRTGPAAGDRTVVLAGLTGAEQVVVEGQFQVDDGKLLDPSAVPSQAGADGARR